MKVAALALILGFAAAHDGRAQDYPAKPIRLIISSSPGSGVDTIGRAVAQRMSEALGVQIDTKHEGHVPFDRCLAVGCQAQLLLEAPLLAKLQGGKTLVFIIYRTQEVGVGIPISLAGFDQALATLR